MFEDSISTDIFIALRGIWSSSIPKPLAKVDPDVLLMFMKYADERSGISQADLQDALNISQSRMSKLKDKMVAAKWAEVWTPDSAKTVLLVRTTTVAQVKMKEVRRKMLSICRTPKP